MGGMKGMEGMEGAAPAAPGRRAGYFGGHSRVALVAGALQLAGWKARATRTPSVRYSVTGTPRSWR